MRADNLRPPRTFGLSIAIISSVILFTVMPLAQVIWLGLLRWRLRDLDYGSGLPPFAVGGDYGDIGGGQLIIRVAFGLLFLMIAAFAWTGRPRGIRWIMLAAVLIMTAFTIIVTLVPLFQAQTLAQGIDSGDTFRHVILGAQLFLSVLIPLYVVWYINRGPARAFYRGYYLTRPR